MGNQFSFVSERSNKVLRFRPLIFTASHQIEGFFAELLVLLGPLAKPAVGLCNFRPAARGDQPAAVALSPIDFFGETVSLLQGRSVCTHKLVLFH